MPSAIGLSFAVSDSAEALSITAEWGYYRPAKSEKETTPTGRPKNVWKRRPVKASHTFPLQEGELGPWSPEPEEQGGVEVRGRCRRRDGAWSLTLFLINNQEEPLDNKDLAWIFQPRLTVAAPDLAPVFVQRPTHEDVSRLQAEDAAMRLLYRNVVEFAVGHGVAVHAAVAPETPHRATKLETRVIPTYAVERMDPPRPEDVPEMMTAVFDMKTLGETEMGAFAPQLTPLLDAYRAWIAAQAARLEKPTPDLRPFLDRARDNLAECRAALARMTAGVALLDSDSQAAQAFRFANEAMRQQRVHSIYARAVRQGKNPALDDIDQPAARSWRPFQLAFILLNIAPFVDPTHAERGDLVDLLWFPTGGGKTEAYLGVAAFAMGIRRLQRGRYHLGYEGVTVLMRYTLRLLTLQQFQRATTLIAACELIRRGDPAVWGDEPFRIGLWVGQRSTPNYTADAAAIVKSQLAGGDYSASYSGSVGGSGTPHQLTTCPWCGRPISFNEIEVESFAAGRGRTIQYCSDDLGECPFSRRQAPGEGHPDCGRGRGDLPPPADADHRHRRQIRPDALERGDANVVWPGDGAVRAARLPLARHAGAVPDAPGAGQAAGDEAARRRQPAPARPDHPG
jgi:hypothetical protein